jgi:hypothetical protein
MTQHTPGPWKVVDESIVTSDDNHCIAVIESDGGYEVVRPQRRANAKLIAAAPDLLTALEDLTDRVDLVLYRGYVGSARIKAARAAIAKATK